MCDNNLGIHLGSHLTTLAKSSMNIIAIQGFDCGGSTRFQPGRARFRILCAFCSRNREWTDFIHVRIISRSPRDDWDAHGVIRDQHRTRTYNFVRDRATYRIRAALIIV